MASQDESAVDVVKGLFDAFNAGDMDRVREILHPDIEWITPETYFYAPARGGLRGIKAWESFPSVASASRSRSRAPIDSRSVGDSPVPSRECIFSMSSRIAR